MPDHYNNVVLNDAVPLTPYAADDEYSQSRFVVDQIKDLQQQGVALNEIAVLFRASFHSFDLEIELSREGFEFVKMGGFKFIESAHIKDVLAHMRVIANAYDRISWYRILLLIEKVGPKTAQRIFEATLNEQSGYFRLRAPREGWPPGLYRCGLFVGNEVSAYNHADEVRFRIVHPDHHLVSSP